MAATRFLYAKRDQSALAWDVRAPRILDHLVACEADVMFLQEVERDAFDDFLAPRLDAVG
jgi:mRNA deadenylase 3'-5' endonuclease subunit Ccr4